MLPPFKMGMGGKLGDGQQIMSWISIDDAVRAVEFAIRRDDIHGVVNVCAPAPVSNAEFTGTCNLARRVVC